jgi:hypothetical protein
MWANSIEKVENAAKAKSSQKLVGGKQGPMARSCSASWRAARLPWPVALS